MVIHEPNHNVLSSKSKEKIELHVPLDEEKILCNYCKRTSSNGIRCLGMCVADSDY